MSIATTGQRLCHIKVAEVAKAAAGELYDKMMGDNEFYEVWKKQNPDASPKQLEKRFIDKNWGKCLDFARQTLTMMLTRPEISEAMKEEIFDILEKDKSIRNKVMVPNTPFSRLM